MEKYIGTKIISAEPAVKDEQRGYKVVYEDGYQSWSPKEVFEKAYRRLDNLTFGLAVEAAKKGLKVSRRGWNGKGMFVYYVPSNKYPAANNKLGTMKGLFPDDLVPYNAYMAIKTVHDTVSTWVPSINDCLAEDWEIVE